MNWADQCATCGHTRIHHGDSGRGGCEYECLVQKHSGAAYVRETCECTCFKKTKVKKRKPRR